MKTVNLVKDPSGTPAVDLSKLRGAHPDLVRRAEKVGLGLSRRDLAGVRTQAMVLLDHSGSMYGDYADGAVQLLVERALGFALQVDVDGVIPVVAFDSKVWPAVDVTVDNYVGVVDREVWHRDRMGSTNMAGALNTLRAMAVTTDAPIFAIVICDGNPDNRDATTRAVCELAEFPVFLKFLAVRPVAYLRELDDLPSGRRGVLRRGHTRLLDNVDSKFIDPRGITDLGFAEAMVDEWDTWITAATAAGILATAR